MNRRVALAAAYTLFVVVLLSTWPLWATAPNSDTATVITAVPVARWLVILIPFYWGWVAYSLETQSARRTGLAVSLVLFVACFLFIWYHDNAPGGPFCLWDNGRCRPGWFN